MNEKRRKQIRSVAGILANAATDLDRIKDDEDDYRDNMPENLQSGDRYQESDEASDGLEDAVTTINEVVENLGKIA